MAADGDADGDDAGRTLELGLAIGDGGGRGSGGGGGGGDDGGDASVCFLLPGSGFAVSTPAAASAGYGWLLQALPS